MTHTFLKIILYIIALILPPLAVLIESGFGEDLIANLFFCIFAWFPGMMHAVYVVHKTP